MFSSLAGRYRRCSNQAYVARGDEVANLWDGEFCLGKKMHKVFPPMDVFFTRVLLPCETCILAQ